MSMRNWINLAESIALTEAPHAYHYFYFESAEEAAWSLRSRADLMYALKHTESQGELRGLISDETVLAWDSWKAVHGDMISDMENYDEEYVENETDQQPINQDWKALVYFYAEGVAMAPKRHGDPNYVRNHSLIQRIYGKDVPIIQPRPGTV